MRQARRLLTLILLAVVPLFGWRALEGAPPLGPPVRAVVCACPHEIIGEGVACVAPLETVRPGDRIERGPAWVKRGRMAPERLAAWSVPIDLNRASLAELASLEGVGLALAGRIVRARPFTTIEEVVRVRGIGPKRFARLRHRLVTEDAGRPVRLDEPTQSAPY